jgi:exopolysaccharide production protein ExoQ
MGPGAAVIAVAIVWLFVLDRDRGRDRPTSRALWIPIIWVSLGASRLPSQWFGVDPRALASLESVTQAADGSPFDRNILAALIAAGVVVLWRRRPEVKGFLRENGPILVFFAYCAISVSWSDHPWVALKRWTKAIGDLVMILIVLTDPSRLTAIKRFLAAIGFLLMPTSILLIRYYPALGRRYGLDGESWAYTGVTTDKNMLGAICLVSGLACVWRLSQAIWSRQGRRGAGPVIAQVILLATVLWLLRVADSMTSIACFVLAGGVIVATTLPTLARSRGIGHLLVSSVLIVAGVALFADVGAGLVETVGRDSTLTGRTDLWKLLLSVNQSPMLGAGFESFWLGDRLEQIWGMMPWRANEAHNGYLEVYLNLGLIGLAVLVVVIVTGYKRVILGLNRDSGLGPLRLGFFVATLVYSLTEAAFREMGPMWILFVWAIAAVPKANGAGVEGATLATVRSRLPSRPVAVSAVSRQQNVTFGTGSRN